MEFVSQFIRKESVCLDGYRLNAEVFVSKRWRYGRHITETQCSVKDSLLVKLLKYTYGYHMGTHMGV